MYIHNMYYVYVVLLSPTDSHQSIHPMHTEVLCTMYTFHIGVHPVCVDVCASNSDVSTNTGCDSVVDRCTTDVALVWHRGISVEEL